MIWAVFGYDGQWNEHALTWIRQVLRYSALGAGVLYGVYHQASLSAAAKVSAAHRAYEHKQSLIEKAKEEYSKKINPPQGDGGTYTDSILCASYYSSDTPGMLLQEPLLPQKTLFRQNPGKSSGTGADI